MGLKGPGKRKSPDTDIDLSVAAKKSRSKLVPSSVPRPLNPTPTSSPSSSEDEVKIQFVDSARAVKSEPGLPKTARVERDSMYEEVIRGWLATVKRRCKECSFHACSTARPRPHDSDHVIVFEDTRSGIADERCKSLPRETALLLSDLLSLGVFSVWMCDPVTFRNDIKGTFEAIYHFLAVHCELEGLRRPDLYNVYHHYASKRGPTVYNRYK